MRKNNLLYIGSFKLGQKATGGQEAKIRNIYSLFEDNYKSGTISMFDTETVRNNPVSIFSILPKLSKVDIVVISLASGGLGHLFPMLFYLSFIFHYKIIFLGFGGWHVEYFMGNSSGEPYSVPHIRQMKMARKIKCFMVENKNVSDILKTECGFTNIDVLPNFRIYNFKLNGHKASKTLKLVYGSRVDKEKGYESLFLLEKLIERERLDITIDIYGCIAEKDKNDFFTKLDNSNTNIIKYCGEIDSDNIYQTYSKYDVMLFPTRYPGEGFAGTILDSYISGIPVVASDWRYNKDYVANNITGYVIPLDNFDNNFQERILYLYNNRSKLLELKLNAYAERLKYDKDEVWRIISKYL
ncbi:MAG: glycosyltransferase [Bacteroidales bacterium]